MVKLAIWDAPIADQASDQNAERLAVLDAAGTYVDLSSLLAELTRRVTYESESQEPSRQAELKRDLTEEIEGVLGEMGFVSSHIDNPVDPGLPMLIARRQEDGALPTVLVYGHGDVVRGDASRWREGLSPWQLKVEEDRWYGRGTADNKGQHTINISALKTVFESRGGKVGFNRSSTCFLTPIPRRGRGKTG